MKSLRRLIDPYLLMLIGVVVLAALLPARGWGAEAAQWVASAAVALLFFLYGARLSPGAIWAGLSHWRLQTMVLAATFILFPVLGLGIYWATLGWVSPDLRMGLLFLCLLPSTVQSSIAFTSIAGGNVPAALCAASLSNLIGVTVTPLLVMLVLPVGGAGVSLSSIENIALQILAPFLVGQAARPLIGAWLTKHSRLTSMVDRGSILLVVYAAFSAGVVSGAWARLTPLDLALVLGLNGVILALAIGATTALSRRLGFSKADEIAIVFCGSKKSMASGIPMATILFAPSTVSLIVIPLMLFHQIQLFVCAVLARRYAQGQVQTKEPLTDPTVSPSGGSSS